MIPRPRPHRPYEAVPAQKHSREAMVALVYGETPAKPSKPVEDMTREELIAALPRTPK